MRTKGSDWSDDRTELLKKLHAKGYSFSIIAAEIGGITRNAAIGKATRLGLVSPTRKETTRPRKPPRPWRSLNSILNERAIKTAELKCEKVEAAPPSDKFLGITLTKLEPQHCRFPEGEGAAILYCGQPKMEGSSYCPSCHARCYTKPPRAAERRVFIPRRVA